MLFVDFRETHSATSAYGKPSTLLELLARAFSRPLLTSQGLHVDPETGVSPDPKHWSKEARKLWVSEEMQLFRQCLQHDGMDVRTSILDELAGFYDLSPQECLRRCLHWEQWSVSEWRAGDRSTREGLRDFYNSVQSWSFDLIWYAYLQSAGFGVPASVAAVRFARKKRPGGTHLDFGSGVGVTSQLFARLGFDTTSADVSKTLLDFAKWRHLRHGDRVHALDLNSQSLPTEHYDVVTAIDTLTHAPDFDATVRDLHRIIRPGGWLLVNFDVRKKGADESAWHLYDDHLDLEFRLQRTGFVRRSTLGGILLAYERVDPSTPVHRLRTIRDRLILGPPIGMFVAAARNMKWPTPQRIRRLVVRTVKSLRKADAAG